MRRFAQLLIAELFAFGALVSGGLALLGGAVTWTGRSHHPAAVSWLLVALLTVLALVLGKNAAIRLRRVFVPDLAATLTPGDRGVPPGAPGSAG